MRINHNIAALNASNRLRSNDNAISKNLQKLSSGYRINSAADDAAGLAVSEKMRAQINGLNQAEDNAQNGISLVQTAEGGLNETESILQRMNTLAVESSNGTYKDETDRKNLNKEVEALKSEVDRISTSTNFNGINLLDGSLGGTTAGGAVAATLDVAGATAVTTTAAVALTQTVAITGADMGDGATAASAFTVSYQTADGQTKTVSTTLTLVSDTTNGSSIKDADGNLLFSTSDVLTSGNVATAVKSALMGDQGFSDAFAVDDSGNDGTLVFTAETSGTSGEKIVGLSKDSAGLAITPTAAADAYESVTFGTGAGELAAYDGTNTASAIFTVNGEKFAFVASGSDASDLGTGVNVVYTTAAAAATGEVGQMSNLINSKTGLATEVDSITNTQINFKASTASTTNGNAVVFQIGSDNKADQRVSLSVDDMSSKGLGIENVSIATQDDAKAAIDTIKAAINTVSATRSDLGALQNRLEHTTNNLSTMSENLTSAESTIRDVDMSSEMVDLTKNQILEQAATSMLAQANSQPQSVLSLLRG